MASSFAYFKALRTCLDTKSWKNSISLAVGAGTAVGTVGPASFSQADATSLEWFNVRRWVGGVPGGAGLFGTTEVNAVNIGAFNDPRGTTGDGSQNCGGDEGKAWIGLALGLWDYDAPKFLCNQLGFSRASGAKPNTAECREIVDGANNDFIPPSDAASKLDDFWKTTLGNTNLGPSGIGDADSTDNFTGPGEYYLYLQNFKTQCRPNQSGTTYTIQDFETGKPQPVKYGIGDSGRDQNYVVNIYSGTFKTCSELVGFINEAPDASGSGGDQAVRAMIKWLNDGNTVGSGFDNGGSCGIVSNENCTTATSCAIPGVGWMICPIMTFLASISDGVYGIIEGFLKTDVNIVNTNSGTYRAWEIMRNFANVGFVVVFLIIIFSQLSSIGITNYGVKKMLPRLIIAAILVNVSFFISQLAVDLSNILGGSLKQLLDNIPVSSESLQTDDLATGNLFTKIVTGWIAGQAAVIGTVAVGGAVYFGGIGLLVPIVLAVLIAIIVTLFILVARQALVVLLVVVSPLAFLAMLLPNTENYFKQWRKIFLSLLLIYPAIALLFGGAQLASSILVDALNGNPFGQIIGIAVLVLPLFALPSILKGSLNAVPIVGGLASKLQSRANSNITGKAKEGYAMSTFGRGRAIRKQAKANYRDKQVSERLSQGGVRGKLAGVAAGGIASLGWTKYQRAQKEALARSAQGGVASAQSEAVKQQMLLYEKQLGKSPDAIQRHIEANHRSMSPVEMEAASDLLLGAGGVSQYRDIIKNPNIMGTHARSLVESGRRNDGEVRKKASDIANWASTTGATSQTNGYDGATTLTEKGVSYIQDAYSSAEAAKLITMDAATAALAEPHIDKNQAKLATGDQNFGSAKTGTQDVLSRVAK